GFIAAREAPRRCRRCCCRAIVRRARGMPFIDVRGLLRASAMGFSNRLRNTFRLRRQVLAWFAAATSAGCLALGNLLAAGMAAVAISAWLGGRASGMLATGTLAVLAWSAPAGWPRPDAVGAGPEAMGFVFGGLLITGLVDAARTSRRRAQSEVENCRAAAGQDG